jgi:hypothetical protein
MGQHPAQSSSQTGPLVASHDEIHAASHLSPARESLLKSGTLTVDATDGCAMERQPVRSSIHTVNQEIPHHKMRSGSRFVPTGESQIEGNARVGTAIRAVEDVCGATEECAVTMQSGANDGMEAVEIAVQPGLVGTEGKQAEQRKQPVFSVNKVSGATANVPAAGALQAVALVGADECSAELKRQATLEAEIELERRLQRVSCSSGDVQHGGALLAMRGDEAREGAPGTEKHGADVLKNDDQECLQVSPAADPAGPEAQERVLSLSALFADKGRDSEASTAPVGTKRDVPLQPGLARLSALCPPNRASSARLSERPNGVSLFSTLTMPDEMSVGGLLTMHGRGKTVAEEPSDLVVAQGSEAAAGLLLQVGSEDRGSEGAFFRAMARTTIHGNPMFFRDVAASSVATQGGASSVLANCGEGVGLADDAVAADAGGSGALVGTGGRVPVRRGGRPRSSSAFVGDAGRMERDHKGLSLFDTLTMPRNLQLTPEVQALAAEGVRGSENFPDAFAALEAAARDSGASAELPGELTQKQMRATVHGNPMFFGAAKSSGSRESSTRDVLGDKVAIKNIPWKTGADVPAPTSLMGDGVLGGLSQTGSDEAGGSVGEITARLHNDQEAVTAVLRELRAALERETDAVDTGGGGAFDAATGNREAVVQRLSACMERVSGLVSAPDGSLCGLKRTAADHFGVTRQNPDAGKGLTTASLRNASPHSTGAPKMTVDCSSFTEMCSPPGGMTCKHVMLGTAAVGVC